MRKFIKDIFSENKTSENPEGKGSAKRTMGILSGVAGIAVAGLSGLHFYDIDINIMYGLFMYSATMLGVSALRAMFK